jgi:predicted deacylase
MRHHHEAVSLPVGSVGNLEISVNVTTLGEGSPHLALVCGVHGDETASLAICRRLVEEVAGLSQLDGKLSIVTAANPFARATRTRVSLSDFYDLNRLGQGSPDGALTERLARRLYEYLSNCSFVIDIHEFEMETPTMAVYFPSDDAGTGGRIRRAVRAFAPETVWVVNVATSEEGRYSKSLISALMEGGVAGFAVETSRMASIPEKGIEGAARGLLEVARFLGIVKGEARESRPKGFARVVRHSDEAGIWWPEASLRTEVVKGKRIGRLTSLDLLEEAEVTAPEDGTLIQLRRTELVATGTSLFTVGTEVPPGLWPAA